MKTKPADKTRGWAAACPPLSPLTKKRAQKRPDPSQLWEPTAKTFVADHQKAMDPCQQPTHIHLNGFLQSQLPAPALHKELVPSFSVCTTSLHSDILTVPTEDWVETVIEDPQWAQKPHKKLYWRGNNTGTFHSPDTWWNLTQRVRFISTAMDKFEEEVYVLPSTGTKYEPVGMGERIEKSLLNDWIDARFTGHPMQCQPGSGLCEQLARSYTFVPPEPTDYEKQWKYLMDVSLLTLSSRGTLTYPRRRLMETLAHPDSSASSPRAASSSKRPFTRNGTTNFRDSA